MSLIGQSATGNKAALDADRWPGDKLKQLRDEAYVLRTQPLGEADLIVSLLTAGHGKLRGVAQAARKSRKRFGGLLEPFTHVHVSWSEKQSRELHRIDWMEHRRSFAEMQADPVNQAACAVLSELAETFGREGEADAKSFRLIGAALEALESGVAPWAVIRYFEFWTLILHGLLPEIDRCHQCERSLSGKLSAWLDSGPTLRCNECSATTRSGMKRFAAAERTFLQTARQQPPSALGQAVEATQPGALERLLRGSLEAFAEKSFRTYKHLRALDQSPGGTRC